MKPFTIHASAEAAIVHYEAQRAGLGRESRQEFESAAGRIRAMPQSFVAIDAQGTRIHRLRRFPYTIYYVDLDDVIWIAAVAHQKQRPRYWSGRRPQDGGEP